MPVVGIGESVFEDSKLTGELVLPKDLEFIGENAFENSKISKIVFNQKLKSIGSAAFNLCENLTGALEMPDSIKFIGTSAFRMCNYTSIKISNNLKVIPLSAFAWNRDLSGTIEVPEGVVAVGESAFGYTKLRSAILPTTLINLSKDAFNGFSDNYFKNLAIKSENMEFFTEGENYTIYLKLNTKTSKYADDNNIPYENIENWANAQIPEGHHIILNYSEYQLNNINEKLTLKDEYIPSNQITWTSTNEKIATVDSNGIVTPKAGGFVYIKASTKNYGTYSCWIYVCMLRTLTDGSKVYPGDLNGDGVINSIDGTIINDWYNKSVLTEDEKALGDLDCDGIITSNDWCMIQDLYNSDSSFTPGPYNPITKITLNKNEATLIEGGNLKLTASITPIDTTSSPNITWKSSNPYVVRVDENGNVTHVSGGTAVITARTSNGLTAECQITSEGEAIYRKITGTVISFTDSSKTNKKVTIELLEKGTGKILRTINVTGNNASYTIDGVTLGEYIIKVSKESHVTREYNVTVGSSDIVQDMKIHLKGDINGDGKVNSADTVKALLHTNRKTKLTGYDLDCADINGDGELKTGDVVKILAHANRKTLLW